MKRMWCRLLPHYFEWIAGVPDLRFMDIQEKVKLVARQLSTVVALMVSFWTFKSGYDGIVPGSEICFSRRENKDEIIVVANILNSHVISTFRKLALGTRFGPVESVIMETAWLKYRSVLVNLVKRNNPKLDYEGVVDRIVALSEIVPYLELLPNVISRADAMRPQQTSALALQPLKTAKKPNRQGNESCRIDFTDFNGRRYWNLHAKKAIIQQEETLRKLVTIMYLLKTRRMEFSQKTCLKRDKIIAIMYSHEKDQRDITAHTFMLTTLRLPSPVKTYEKIVSAYRKLSVITRERLRGVGERLPGVASVSSVRYPAASTGNVFKYQADMFFTKGRPIE
ncbi:hypothetical protein RB195_001521 [Necator americanus]|uniref:Uncharacterized protein n=1 Tax=Necator americanus TaxID=51031 RepID=A0ABR1DEP0_NECAM